MSRCSPLLTEQVREVLAEHDAHAVCFYPLHGGSTGPQIAEDGGAAQQGRLGALVDDGIQRSVDEQLPPFRRKPVTDENDLLPTAELLQGAGDAFGTSAD